MNDLLLSWNLNPAMVYLSLGLLVLLGLQRLVIRYCCRGKRRRWEL